MTLTVGTRVRFRDTSAAQRFSERFGGYPETGREYVVEDVDVSPDDDGDRLLLTGLPRKVQRLIRNAGGVPAALCEAVCGCPLFPS